MLSFILKISTFKLALRKLCEIGTEEYNKFKIRDG